MGKYKVEFSKKALKEYERLPAGYKNLVDMALSKMANGLSADVRPVQGRKDVYRLRVGKYRLLFAVVEDTILVVKVGTRGDIYK